MIITSPIDRPIPVQSRPQTLRLRSFGTEYAVDERLDSLRRFLHSVQKIFHLLRQFLEPFLPDAGVLHSLSKLLFQISDRTAGQDRLVYSL